MGVGLPSASRHCEPAEPVKQPRGSGATLGRFAALAMTGRGRFQPVPVAANIAERLRLPRAAPTVDAAAVWTCAQGYCWRYCGWLKFVPGTRAGEGCGRGMIGPAVPLRLKQPSL